MRYQIPQFIEMEDKVIGPFTLRQFIYLIAVPAICYVLHFFVRMPYVILVGAIFFPIALMLAFFKVNGRPFSQVLTGLFKFVSKPQIYVWKRKPVIVEKKKEAPLQEGQHKKIKTSQKPNFKKIAKMLDEK